MEPNPKRGRTGRPAPLTWRLDGAATSPDAPLVVTLHGYRMNEDFFARLLRGALDLPIHVLSLRGSIPVDGLRGEGEGASWYEYDGDQERFLHELSRVEGTLLSALAEAERSLGLTPRWRVLLGFSQGGYAGAVIALRHPELFRGLIVSGARVKDEILSQDLPRAAAAGFEVLLLHGEQDQSVSLDAAKRGEAALRGAGLSIELVTFPAGHSLGRAQVAALREWLRKRTG